MQQQQQQPNTRLTIIILTLFHRRRNRIADKRLKANLRLRLYKQKELSFLLLLVFGGGGGGGGGGGWMMFLISWLVGALLSLFFLSQYFVVLRC